ncbi:MAG TPA: DUF1007 family protein [Pseudolabrys sp.]|jgi:ABC-type uncharacterized transport system substrate-binding protein|nr:DUF1007 family protein [Pseudolabrys sp.]
MIRAVLIAIFSLAFALPASAHPHVWVTMHTELIYAPDGSVTGVHHDWAFDDMFSAFATQGMKAKVKGQFTREELAPLAKVNVESLKEYGYFTYATADGKKAQLTDPAPGYWLDYKNTILTLHFTLPFKTPVKAKYLRVEIYDPTIFVDFEFAKKDPVHLVGAPAGCKLDVALPHDITVAQSQKLGEAFFSQLNASQNWGAQFANKILVNCP